MKIITSCPFVPTKDFPRKAKNNENIKENGILNAKNKIFHIFTSIFKAFYLEKYLIDYCATFLKIFLLSYPEAEKDFF